MKKLFLVSTALTLTLSTVSFAHDKNSKHGKSMMEKMEKMTPEQRQKMADAHEKMAACLRSDKAVKDCHEEMKKACHDAMGGACPMERHHKMKKEIKIEKEAE